MELQLRNRLNHAPRITNNDITNMGKGLRNGLNIKKMIGKDKASAN